MIKSCLFRINAIQRFRKPDAAKLVRLCSNHSDVPRDVNVKVESNLRSKDSISEDYRIIYRAPILNYVQVTYGVTFSTMAVLPPILVYALAQKGIGNYPLALGNWELIGSQFDLVGAVGALILVTFQVSYVVFKYPFRIYHNASTGKYIAIYQHLLPWKKEQVEFNAGDMRKVEKSYSLWHDNLYAVKNKRAILLEDYFFLPQDFNDMIGVKRK